ncbi:hypothetical protein PC117_g17527 [Phytophthora cactorum]|nr:hypothetical protein PC117_g17527 [Phytophthora cactorum]
MYKQQQEENQKQKEGSHRQLVSFLDALKTTDGSNRASTGYGLSALEENDDIDVYGTVSMAQFDRVIAPLGARKDVKRLDSSAQESRRHEKSRRSRALCSDGRPVLPGFELALSKEKLPKVLNLRLTVPSDFKAYHRFDDDEDQGDAVTALYRKYNFSTDKMSNGLIVTAKQRGALLGDDKQDAQGDTGSAAGAAGEVKSSTGSVFDLLGEEQKAKLFNAAAQAKQGFSLSSAKRTTTIDVTAAPKVRQPLVSGSGGDQFRATISASIAKRFVSSKSNPEEDKSGFVGAEESPAKMSRRSQSLWIPKSLLCKRFHVKCAGPTGSNGKYDENDKKRDLFDKELVPHLVEFAADRAAHRQSEDDAVESSKFTNTDESNTVEDRDLPPLPAVEKASTDLLKSIFEPSDESELSEDDSEDESDDEGNNERRNEVQGEAKQQGQTSSSASTTPLLARDAVDVQLQVSSEESSSSDEDDASSFVGGSGSGNGDDTRGRKRSHSVDDASGRDAKQRPKEEKKRPKKHKKHHKHRSSRGEKDKKRKKDKKDRKERKSHKHRSSKRSRSRSAERNFSRHRSSSRRH